MRFHYLHDLSFYIFLSSSQDRGKANLVLHSLETMLKKVCSHVHCGELSTWKPAVILLHFWFAITLYPNKLDGFLLNFEFLKGLCMSQRA